LCCDGHALSTFEALIHLDAIVQKAAVIEEAKRLSEIERRLYEVSIGEFRKRAKVALSELTKSIASGKAKDEASLSRLLDRFDSHFKTLPKTLGPFYTKATEEAYKAGFEAILKKAVGTYPRNRDITYPSPHKFESVSDEWTEREKASDPIATLTPTFSVIDEDAIATLSDHQVFWIGVHYDKALSDTIANTATDAMIKEGFDRAEGAKKVQSELENLFSKAPGAFTAASIVPHGWSGSIAQYYEGLAANTMTVARTFGTLNGLQRVGAQSYTISNPMDERTCPVCSNLEGTVFQVSEGADLMNRALATKNPEEVKRIIRWDSLKGIEKRTGVTPSGSSTSKTEASALAKNGYGIPPFHFRCRCTLDINSETEFGVPLPTPEFELPQGGKLTPIHFDKDLAKMQSFHKEAGGVHQKLFFRENDGTEWMFKPYHAGEEFRAYGDVAAARMAEALGHPTAEVYVTEYNGRVGSVHKWINGVKGDFKGVNYADLTKNQMIGIQKEHAFDWLISNHDGHSQNLITLADDSILGIDKGQLYKFFPRDKLSWTYSPNAGGGFPPPIYNEVLEGYAKGAFGDLKLLDLRNKELRSFFKAVDDLDDATFTSILKTYSSKRAQAFPDFDEAAFLKEALKRKNSLRDDMSGIWKKAQKERDKVIGKKPKGIKGQTNALKKKGLATPCDSKFISQVEESKWRGKSLLVGGDNVRDGTVLVYPKQGGVMVEMRLTAEGDAIARKLFETAGAQPISELPELTSLRSQLEEISKKIRNRFGDAVVPEASRNFSYDQVQQALNLIRQIESKWGYGALQDYKIQVKAWYDTGANRFNIKNMKKKFGLSKFEQQGSNAFKPVGWKRYNLNPLGEIEDTGDLARVMNGYEIELKGGVKIRYVAGGENAEHFSAERLFQIEFSKSIKQFTPEDMAGALAELDKRGLSIPLASKKELEYIMLKTIAERYYRDTIYDSIDWATENYNAKLKKLRDWAETIAKGPIKAKPIAQWYGGYGKTVWARFDIDPAVVKKLKKNHKLLHHFYSGDTGIEFLRNVASNKSGFLSTEEKFRVGIIPRGWSPGTDMQYGGARMGFSRVRTPAYQNSNQNFRNIWFEPDDAFNSNVYTYKGDKYGTQHWTEGYGGIRRNQTLPDDLENVWKALSESKGGDETIFENGIDLGKLSRVYVSDEYEKEEAIKILKQLEDESLFKFKNKPESIVKIGSGIGSSE